MIDGEYRQENAEIERVIDGMWWMEEERRIAEEKKGASRSAS
jgi:hypothetical protein